MNSLSTPQKPPQSPNQGNRLTWGRLMGCSLSLAIHSARFENRTRPILVVVPDNFNVSKLRHEMHFFDKQKNDLCLTFSDWETLPYDRFSPHQDIISGRLKTLYHLSNDEQGFIITSVSTLMQRITPKCFLERHTFFLDVGDKINLDDIRTRLTKNGYRNTNQVFEHGEFAVRGGILDLFPMGSAKPFRIELFDNEVESIRSFDPDTQRSTETINSICLLPAKEFPTDADAITRFRQNFRDIYEGKPTNCPAYSNVSDGIFTPGIEYYLPLFLEETCTLFDYLQENTLIIAALDIQQATENFWREITERYEQRRHDVTHPILPPEQLFLPPNKLREKIKSFSHVLIPEKPFKHNPAAGKYNFNVTELPDISIDNKKSIPLESLRVFLNGVSDTVLFCAESAGRRETLLALLRDIDCRPNQIANWNDLSNIDTQFAITVGPLEKGCRLVHENITIITEADIFGRQVMQRRLRKKRHHDHDPDLAIYNLSELHIGAPVVHAEHGVARYMGLETISLNNKSTEFITLMYANDDKLYVPVTALHLISPYSGAAFENAPLHKLGSAAWEKAKKKAAKRLYDVAAELLAIYAKRAAKQGFAFPKPDSAYHQFSAGFPFEETPDQQTTINSILTDMAKDTPMDRLVCGDVGFGKTEVAMRAAFIAVDAGKQVCFLVPTTLLAEQHFQTLTDRFADHPVRVDMLSRFRSTREQSKTIDAIKAGKVDIVVGTHKLLQDVIKFKDLGLIIIDEEHRFGVRQKEHLKALRAEVDMLTLTATPIPRTLNMALSDIRDLSIIATPPAKRLSIKTFVHENDDTLIQESIAREILRGGQVYFLHNDVATIEHTAKTLADLVPQARVKIAHGQMRERELERTMSDFYHHKFNVLVCTTIIETGIDIPSANTIIIHRADKFGLAQLHQLRGRVGRSHHQAYAYLLTPKNKKLTKEAEKRLEAIAAHEDLGIGFTLAMHDLEIRGAGALLGDEQSGNMHEIGFSLYNEMLGRAVAAIKKGEEVDLTKPLSVTADINLHTTALIPETFVADVHTRLQYYKRIAGAKTEAELDDIMAEMIDCFGLLPRPLKNLFAITELKLDATKLGIEKIELTHVAGRIDFSEKPTIDPAKLISLIQTEPDTYKLSSPTTLRLEIESLTFEDKVDAISALFDRIFP